MIRAIGSALCAGLVMGMSAGLAGLALGSRVDTHALWGKAIDALIPLALGAALYLLVAALMHSDELRFVLGLARRMRL
jgi:membrane-associated PAP2 superfamily phosphatase